MSGTLYIVATPIGNLEDMTFRAVRILREVDAIACEDTRQTGKLLHHYDISRPLLSYHDHNEQARTEDILERLERGQSLALVSDAGTPLISDPGYRLVSRARAAGVAVVPIPGCSALITAVCAAGLPTDAFAFGGFLPPKSAARRRALEEWRAFPGTVAFYEAPHRIEETLADLAAVYGTRPVVLARELTKRHEEFLAGDAATLLAGLQARAAIKGEFVILLDRDREPPPALDNPLASVELLVRQGVSRMDAIKQIAREHHLPKRDLYRLVEQEGKVPPEKT